MFDGKTRHGNGNKANMRIKMLEGLLESSESSGGSATVNSLKQVLRRNKADIADDAETSLDRMRMIYQNEISKEIHQIVERHVRTTFSPAIENLKRNGHIVDNEVINDLVCGILEAAKKPFQREKARSVEKENEKELDSTTQPEPYRGTDKGDYGAQRGEESDDSEMSTLSQSSNTRRRLTKREEDRFLVDLSPFTLHELSKWNPERFSITTLFVPASKVAALTLLTTTKFFHHYARLFRYCLDDADKVALTEELRPVRDNGRSYLVCLEDAREVVGRSAELDKIAFTLKEFILIKIRRYAHPIFENIRPKVESLYKQQQQPLQQPNIMSNHVINGAGLSLPPQPIAQLSPAAAQLGPSLQMQPVAAYQPAPAQFPINGQGWNFGIQ